MSFNIAIDGPSGAGKSTIAKRVAQELNYIYVDTGAMYRAMACFMLERGVDIRDEEAVTEACQEADIAIVYREGQQRVLLNGADVTEHLRREEVGNTASAVGVYGAVRQKLTQLQKELAARENVVMDGRDIGTAVLPGAQAKIYLTASAHIRAARRCAELEQKGEEAILEDVERDIIARDARDMNREISPLRQADDAVLVDSSELGIEEVVGRILEICRTHGCM